jgi:hypothetical protein
VVGEKFGRLTITGLCRSGVLFANCICDCGTEKSIRLKDLKRGMTRSCGCLARQVTVERCSRLATHRMSASPEHKIWRGMIDRCRNPKSKYYPGYGGRGIAIDPAWDSFEAFYRDMGPRPSGKHSIDRIDNNSGYSPVNCRWATWEQQENNRRSCRYVSFDGRSQTITQWARERHIKAATVFTRIRKGSSPEVALGLHAGATGRGQLDFTCGGERVSETFHLPPIPRMWPVNGHSRCRKCHTLWPAFGIVSRSTSPVDSPSAIGASRADNDRRVVSAFSEVSR